MNEQKEYRFHTETAKLLQMVIHSVYSKKEIFLRELISNASDALDRRYALALKQPDQNLGPLQREAYSINLLLQKEKRLLWIRDNGIGMDSDDLYRCLGTIAHSGTGEEETDEERIGQFGIGFYSLFMAADHVRVVSRKAGKNQAYAFESSGIDSYTISEAKRDTVGTDVILHIREDDGNDTYNRYLREYTLYKLVKQYSDYIRWPILLYMPVPVPGKNGEPEERWGWQRLNSMVPLWRRKAGTVTEQEYNAFWLEQFAKDLEPAAEDREAFAKPLKVLHLHVEGRTEFRALLYIPACKWRTYDTERDVKGLQLYSAGVRIKERETAVLPQEFSFVQGAVDCSDLPLNLSREILQAQDTLNAIRSVLAKKLTEALQDVLQEDRSRYERFFRDFGQSLKLSAMECEGKQRERLSSLLLFASTGGTLTLDEYLQKEPSQILFGAAENADALKKLPEAERPLQEGRTILCLADLTDRLLPEMLETYRGVPFVSITSSSACETSTRGSDLCAFAEEVLKNENTAVRMTDRLVTGPVVLTTESGLSADLEAQMAETDSRYVSRYVLELNPEHRSVQILDKVRITDPERAEKYVRILYTQACLTAGLKIPDLTEYTALLVSLFEE